MIFASFIAVSSFYTVSQPIDKRGMYEIKKMFGSNSGTDIHLLDLSQRYGTCIRTLVWSVWRLWFIFFFY